MSRNSRPGDQAFAIEAAPTVLPCVSNGAFSCHDNNIVRNPRVVWPRNVVYGAHGESLLIEHVQEHVRITQLCAQVKHDSNTHVVE